MSAPQYDVPLMATLSSDGIRAALRALPTSVVLVAAQLADGPVGMLASSFTSVSLDPPLVSVAFMRSSSTWPRLHQASTWGISLLSGDSASLLQQLSRPAPERFQGVETRGCAGGAVVLPDAPLSLVVAPGRQVEAGDHVLELLHVLAIEGDTAHPPLVLHDRTPHSLVAHRP